MAELKLWGSGYRTNKVKLVAAFAGVNVEQQLAFTHGTTNKTPQFLAMNDLGKVRQLSKVFACTDFVAAVRYFERFAASAEPPDIHHYALRTEAMTAPLDDVQLDTKNT